MQKNEEKSFLKKKKDKFKNALLSITGKLILIWQFKNSYSTYYIGIGKNYPFEKTCTISYTHVSIMYLIKKNFICFIKNIFKMIINSFLLFLILIAAYGIPILITQQYQAFQTKNLLSLCLQLSIIPFCLIFSIGVLFDKADVITFYLYRYMILFGLSEFFYGNEIFGLSVVFRIIKLYMVLEIALQIVCFIGGCVFDMLDYKNNHFIWLKR